MHHTVFTLLGGDEGELRLTLSISNREGRVSILPLESERFPRDDRPAQTQALEAGITAW